jgi:hypothetical protein
MDFSSHVSGARDGKLYENLYVSLISTCEQIIINKLERKRERETERTKRGEENEDTAISQ